MAPIDTVRIPFNRPSFGALEEARLRTAIERGHFSGDGAFTNQCHELLQESTGAARALLTTSCTAALEMSALLLDIQPGDEVIVPAFTFVSTVNAFVLRGARPIFIDIRPDTLNLDERLLDSLITPRTRAILPVHYAGVGCEMDPIMALAEERGLAIVEDNAHGLFGRYRGRPLGSFGTFATQSFHETKNLSCGEGGALLINDPKFVARAEVIREKGTNRSRYFRGQVDKYTWVDIGSSYLPSELLAAILLAQLEQRETIQAHRRALWLRYDHALRDWSIQWGVRQPRVPEYCDAPSHLYHLLMPDLDRRSAFIAHMRQCGILTPFHYQPLHLSDMGVRFGGRRGECPITEDVSDRLVRLPLFNSLTQDDQNEVIERVLEFRFNP